MNKPTKKGELCWLLLFILSFNLYALDYLQYDFRDINTSIHFKSSLTPRSNALALNIFEKKWDAMPDYNSNNTAFGVIDFDLYYNFSTFKLGIFDQQIAAIEASGGFIQTWYYASRDFNTLLHMSGIGSKIDYTDIGGEANYLRTQGVYIQKVFTCNSENFVSFKLKFYNAKEIQYLKLNGYNDSKRFQGNFDYFYSNKNYISKNSTHDRSYGGYGLGGDIEYIFNNQNIYFYAGILNIGSFIKWRSITKMHYDLDSQTKYLGDDGYYHLKPFGSGRYEYDTDFYQRLPLFYRSSFDYKIDGGLSIGDNMNGFKNIRFNEIYLNKKIYNTRYKLGYVYEAKELTFGFYSNNFSIDISNNLGLNNDYLQANLHIYY